MLDKMMPYLTVYHGNPHSRTHMYGWETEAAVEHARQVSILALRIFTVMSDESRRLFSCF